MLEILLAVHVAAGVTGLSTLWIPMVAPKGGPLHRRVGWVFVTAMAVVSATAIGICAIRLLQEPGPQARLSSIFLGYLAVLTGAGAYKGVRVLRAKQRAGRTGNPLDLVVAGTVVACAIALTVAGIAWRAPLLQIFGVIGLVGGGNDLRYWLRPPREKMHWWYEHMGDMVGTSLAALTAFLIQGARGLFAGPIPLLVWLLPVLVGVPLLILWQGYYRRRFTSASPALTLRAGNVRSAIIGPP